MTSPQGASAQDEAEQAAATSVRLIKSARLVFEDPQNSERAAKTIAAAWLPSTKAVSVRDQLSLLNVNTRNSDPEAAAPSKPYRDHLV